MRKIFLLFIFFSFIGYSQNDSIILNEYERVYIEVGVVQPLGKLANKFNVSPSFGFWFRNRIVREDYIDFGFNFFIPKNARKVSFKYKDSIVAYESKNFAISIGARFAKLVPMSNKTNHFNLEWNSGIGLALNFYQAPQELDFVEGEFTREVLTTFYLSQGVTINYKNIGIQFHYNFLPYAIFNEKIYERNYGSHSLLFGLVYRQ